VKVRWLLGDQLARESMGRAGLARVTEFGWDATARRTLALLDEERRRRSPLPLPRAAGLEPARVELGSPNGSPSYARERA